MQMTIATCHNLCILRIMNKQLLKACKIVGSQEKLAKELGVSRQAVQQWCQTKLPATRVRAVERLTGGLVTRYKLRPDVFGKSASS